MHKHGFSAELIKTAASILNGEEPIEEKMSSKEKMKKGLYNDNSNDKSDDGEGMDKVQPKALKKKFDNRKDKDIDNDGDQDSSDEYVHNRRKAISKAMKNESLDMNESVRVYSMDMDTGKGEKHIDKAIDLHKKHKFTGVKFHTAMGDDLPHALSIHKDSPAHKHPEFHKAIKKLPVQFKSTDPDDKDMSGTSVHKESVDVDAKNVSKALKHDCATHIVHEKWGKGQCIPGMHTLVQISEEEGIVTHYDVLFDHGIEEDVSVSEMKVIKSMNHGHPKKKNK